MKKIIRFSIVGIASLAILFLFSYMIAPNKTKEVSKQVLVTSKKNILKVRGKYHETKFNSYQPSTNEIWGIDVSHHQREIKWNEIENNKPYFVFLKATEGTTHIDTKHKEYKEKFSNLSIPTGSYHFFSYSTSGTAQAKHFLKHAEVSKGNLIPVLDVEFTNKMPGKDEIIKNVNQFIAHIVDELGVAPLIYCECDFYEKYLKGNLNNECNYWISDFWREPKCDYIFWQKTDKFQHKAFKGTIDFNILKGDMNDLKTLLIK